MGEELAVWFLSERGLSIEARNVPVAGGEVDVVARDHGARVVVEVRASLAGRDPIDAIDAAKRRRVRMLAGHLGARRVDFLGVRLSARGCDIHWVPAGF